MRADQAIVHDQSGKGGNQDPIPCQVSCSSTVDAHKQKPPFHSAPRNLDGQVNPDASNDIFSNYELQNITSQIRGASCGEASVTSSASATRSRRAASSPSNWI